MRIVTWNCYRGALHDRAALLGPLNPDVVVLQECGRPVEGMADGMIWFGEKPIQGVGIQCKDGYKVTRGPEDPAITHSVFPARISGRVDCNLLAVWSKPRPSYVAAIVAGLDAYAEFIRSAPTVVVGDFNSNAVFDKGKATYTHAALVSKLRNEFGLVSAYHTFNQDPEREEPTLYHLRKRSSPFHIDYCFIPADWVPTIRAVEVGDFETWADHSDHRPLMVDVAL